MTNEEARQWFLKVYSEIKGQGYADENEEAYELAIKALEQEPTDKSNLEKIRCKLQDKIEIYVCEVEENTLIAQGMLKALGMMDEVLEKAEQEPIEKITLWGGEQFVSIDTYQQVCKERDIAIEQLHELGYQLGEKIEPCEDTIAYNDDFATALEKISKYEDKMAKMPCEDAVSRQAVLDRREILRDEQGTGHQAVKTKYIRELPSVQPKRNE